MTKRVDKKSVEELDNGGICVMYAMCGLFVLFVKTFVPFVFKQKKAVSNMKQLLYC